MVASLVMQVIQVRRGSVSISKAGRRLWVINEIPRWQTACDFLPNVFAVKFENPHRRTPCDVI